MVEDIRKVEVIDVNNEKVGKINLDIKEIEGNTGDEQRS